MGSYRLVKEIIRAVKKTVFLVSFHRFLLPLFNLVLCYFVLMLAVLNREKRGGRKKDGL